MRSTTAGLGLRLSDFNLRNKFFEQIRKKTVITLLGFNDPLPQLTPAASPACLSGVELDPGHGLCGSLGLV